MSFNFMFSVEGHSERFFVIVVLVCCAAESYAVCRLLWLLVLASADPYSNSPVYGKMSTSLALQWWELSGFRSKLYVPL